MNRPSLSFWTWIAALLLGLGLSAACSSNQQAKPAKKSAVDQDNGQVAVASGDDGADEYDDEDDGDPQDEDDGEDNTGGGDDDDGRLSAEDDNDLEEDAEDFGEFKNPQRLQECNDDGKLFDRYAQVKQDELKCHTATYPADSYECTRAGIIEYYGNTQEAKDTLAKILDTPPKLENDSTCNNFQMDIDQCGERNGQPYVFFIGTCRGDDGELNIIYHQIPGQN